MMDEYPIGDEGVAILEQEVEQVKKDGKNFRWYVPVRLLKHTGYPGDFSNLVGQNKT